MSWPVVKLGDICDLFNGYAFKSADYVDESNTLSCRMSNIRPGGKFDIEYNARYLPDDFVEKYEQFLLKNGDVVIAMTDLADSPKILGVPTIIKTNGKSILLNQRVGKLIIKELNKVHFPYLQLALNSSKVRSIYKRFAGGGLQINLGKADLLSVEIPLPPLEEQQKIAAILDAADSLRQKDQQLIDKYNALSQSLFFDMFGDPETNPMGWDIEPFDYFASIDTQMTTDFVKYANVPHIGIANIEKGTGKLINYNLVKDENLTSGKYIFTPEHITYSKIRPNLNKVALPSFNGLSSAGSYPILVHHNKANKLFFTYILRSAFFLDFILQHSTRTNIPKANKSQMKLFKGIAPPISIQNKFGELIQSIESQKHLAQTSLQKSEALFNSLLQRAFNGELS
ncbi:MAG: restriction endonuclease subunit S [Methylobacter sp.]